MIASPGVSRHRVLETAAPQWIPAAARSD